MSLKDWLKKGEKPKEERPATREEKAAESPVQATDLTEPEITQESPTQETEESKPEPLAAAPEPEPTPEPKPDETATLFKEVEHRIIRAKEPTGSERQSTAVTKAEETIEEAPQEIEEKPKTKRKEKANVFTRYWWVFAGAAAILVGWAIWRTIRSRRREVDRSGGPWYGPEVRPSPGAPAAVPVVIPPPPEPKPVAKSPEDDRPKDKPPPEYRAADIIVDSILGDAQVQEKLRRQRRTGD